MDLNVLKFKNQNKILKKLDKKMTYKQDHN